MKALMITLFLTLVAINAFGQIPPEIDYESRYLEYSQVQERFLQIKERVKVLRAQAESASAQLSDAQARLDQKKNKRKTNKARLDEITLLITNAINTTTELEAQKKNLEAQIAVLASKVQKQTTVVNDKNAKVDALKPKVKVIEDKLALVKTELDSAQKSLALATSSYNKAKEQANQAQGQIERIKNSLKTLITKNSELEKSLSGLSEDDPKAKLIKSAIATNKKKIETLNNSKVEQEKVLATSQKEMEIANTKKTTYENKVQKLKTDIANIKSSAGDIYTKFEAAKNDLNEAKILLKKTQDEQAVNKDSIAKLGQQINRAKTTLTELRQENKSIQAEQLKLKDSIVRLEIDIKKLIPIVNSNWAQFEEAKIRQEKINRRAERLYVIYEETKIRFDSYMTAAIEAGRNQAISLGVNLGSEDGDKLGDKNGSEDALILGKELGLLKGYLAGLKDGHASGKDQGYQTGYNLPNNYEKGYQLGLVAGKEQAYTDAENDDYPKGRLDKQKELLNRALNGSSLNSSSTSAASFELAIDTSYHYEGIKNTNNKATGDAILDLIDSIKTKIDDLEKKVSDIMANPSTKIEIIVPNVLGNLRCPSQYPANYIEFLNACKESFLNQFQLSYTDSFQAEYNHSYLRNFEQSLNEQEASHQNIRVQEGYDKAYKPTFNKYKLIGAQDAQNKGYNDGHKKAYQDNIKTARRLAYERGQKDEQTYFNTHAVVRLLKAGLNSTEGKFIPGAKVKLAIEVGNFGSVVAANEAVTIQVVSLDQGLKFVSTQNVISEVKALSKVADSAILEAVVGEDVQPGQALKVKVNVLLNGKVVDAQDVLVKADSDYNAEAVIETNLAPKFRTFSRKETAKITVTNLSRTKLISGLTVKMSANNSNIDISDTILNLGVLTKGATASVTFEYKGKKKLRGKNITLSFDVIYNGKIIKTQKVQIKPI